MILYKVNEMNFMEIIIVMKAWYYHGETFWKGSCSTDPLHVEAHVENVYEESLFFSHRLQNSYVLKAYVESIL